MTNHEETSEGDSVRGVVQMGGVVCTRCDKPVDRCLCDVRLVAHGNASIYLLEPEKVLVVMVPLAPAMAGEAAPPGYPLLVTYCVESVVEGAAVFDRPADPKTVDDELLYRMGPAAPARQRVAGVVAELLAAAAGGSDQV